MHQTWNRSEQQLFYLIALTRFRTRDLWHWYHIELHAPTSSTQKIKLMWRGGQFTYIPTVQNSYRASTRSDGLSSMDHPVGLGFNAAPPVPRRRAPPSARVQNPAAAPLTPTLSSPHPLSPLLSFPPPDAAGKRYAYMYFSPEYLLWFSDFVIADAQCLLYLWSAKQDFQKNSIKNVDAHSFGRIWCNSLKH